MQKLLIQNQRNFSGKIRMPKRWISPKECAEYLGLHKKSVYRLICKEKIPASKIGGSIRVDLRKLEEILEERKVGPR